MFTHLRGKGERGFTLIELLVVIAIIGILSSVVLASLNSARTKSRDARRISDLGQVQLALELYFDSCGQYPATLAIGANQGCAATPITFGDFLDPIPRDPVADTIPYYHAAHTGTIAVCMTYHLGYTLEDANHNSFGSDADVIAAPGTAACTGSIGWLTGADPVYDLRP